MTRSASRILIIGGGFSGMAAAIQLRRQGAEVDLVEIDPGWRSYGAGISLGGATLRAFRTLGILDAFLEHGNAADGVDICLPHGPQVAELPTPRIAGPDVPGGGAIMRPVLARILAEATRASGTKVRLGCTFTSIEQDAEGVEVAFTDGSRRRYDLVIGADGLYSKVRESVFPQAPKPQYSGQAVWRAVLPRPPEIETCVMWMGPRVKPGVNPVSKTEMYLFVTEPRPTNEHVDPRHLCGPSARPAGRLSGARAAGHPRPDRPGFADRLPPARRPADAAPLVQRPCGADRRHGARHHPAPGLGRLHRH